MKIEVEESGIEFSINGTYVIKLDEHPFYKYFSGQGFKAVDFLLLEKDQLYLIEVKNYSYYPGTIRPSEKDLHQQFLEKCEDTLHLLDNFYEFMQKSFIRRVLVQKWKWYFIGHPEWKDWLAAYHVYQLGNVVCLLHAD